MTPTCKPVVIAMVAAGLRRGQVAKQLGVTPTRVTQICNECGVPPLVRQTPQRTRLNAVRAMHAARFTDEAMARRLECSRWTILRMRHRMGLPGRRQGEPMGVDERHIAQLYRLVGRDYSDQPATGAAQ